ncbi:MAG: hypothetical protein ACPGSM_12715 [Thiolinea sp.]
MCATHTVTTHYHTMPQVNITQAAKLAGLSRSHFQKNYVKTGRITVSRDNKDRPQIDTAELLRVFGELHHTPAHTAEEHTTTHQHTPESHTTEIALLQQQLADAQQREQEAKSRAEQQEESFVKREEWYQSQIKNLTDTMKLLEAPKHPPHPHRWYQFWK